MDKQELKDRVAAVIDERSGHIKEVGNDILRHPELGFKEHRTSALVERELRAIGLTTKTGLAVTGVRGDLTGSAGGPRLALFGELDSVISRGHAFADLETGAAHACGHNAQVAGMLGAASGLAGAGAMRYLAGEVSFFGVPAEELVEIEFRQELRKRGVIDYLLGKQQLIADGELNGVDIGLMFHLESRKKDIRVSVGGSHNGAVAKFVRYKGKEAHAGGAPHLGVNALNAAVIGLVSINAQRETFQDRDSVRVHPIVTKGGDIVNTVPADVSLEMFVRARTIEAIEDAGLKVNRALKAGADAVGAKCELLTLPGYMPRRSYTLLDQVFAKNAKALVGDEHVDETEHRTGSTDMGDVSQLMPALHPYFRAAEGTAHTESFTIVDEDLAYVTSAKALAFTVIDLLWDGGLLARDIAASYPSAFKSVSEYREAWERMTH